MFFFKRKKKKQADNAPVWFMWLMGGFVVYALITNLFTDNVAKVQDETVQRETPDMDYFNFPVVSGRGFSGPARPLFSRDITAGSGETAECWYAVQADYKLYNASGELIEDTREGGGPASFVIGQSEVPLALERGALGMREEGKRAITAHPSMLFGDYRFSHPKMRKDQYGGYIITMKSVERPAKLPFSDLGLRSYDDAVGEGKLAQCTDRVRIKLRGWTINGQPLWKDKNLPAIMVNIGAGKAPYAIERGLIGMRIDGKRTLIVPPGYMQPLFAMEKEAGIDAEKANEKVMPALKLKEEETPKTKTEESALERAAKELEEMTVDNFAWESLPVPSDSVIILEIELLPEKIELPSN